MSIGNDIVKSVSVAFSPTQFYREMPRAGGLLDPAAYVLAMAVLAVVLCAIGALFNSDASFFGTLFGSLVPHIVRVFVTVAVASVALYFLWQRLGSEQTFEASARTVAYLAVFSPIWVVLAGVLGVVGKLIVSVWLVAVLIVASTQVHGIERRPAAISLIGLAILLVLLKCSFQRDGAEQEQAADVGSNNAVVQSSTADEDDAYAPLLEQAEHELLSGESASDNDAVLEREIMPLAIEKAPAEQGTVMSELENKAEQAGELIGGLVNELDDSVEKVGDQLATAAQDFKQSFSDKEDAGNDVTGVDEEAAQLPSETSSEEKSLATSAGEALGTVVEGVGDIISGVQEGFENAVSEPTDSTNADAQSDIDAETQERLSPEQLGEAMAAFMSGVDRAIGESAESIEEAGEQASDALARFMESYHKALEQQNSDGDK